MSDEQALCLKDRGHDDWFSFGVGVVIGFGLTLALLLALAGLAGAASPLSITMTPPADTNFDPLPYVIHWTSSCNVTAITPQTQQDDGAWINGAAFSPPNPRSGDLTVELAKNHLWRVRLTASFDAGGNCGSDEPSNALEVDLRSKGLFGLGFCGLVVLPVPVAIGVVYVAQRRKGFSKPKVGDPVVYGIMKYRIHNFYRTRGKRVAVLQARYKSSAAVGVFVEDLRWDANAGVWRTQAETLTRRR